MLLLVLFVLPPTILGLSQRAQPPGCPFPTGPYVPPKCGKNEYFEVCSFKCPPQTCADSPCDPGDGCCRNECRCNDGYLRNSCGNCIPADQCPGRPCLRQCKPTCSVPNPKNCKSNDKCNCKKGNVWSEDRSKCIPINECPQDLGCNSDPNAVIMENPPPCPSTCKQPNQPNCLKLGLEVGCVCKYGYILSTSKVGGKCILPDKCPGGNPCAANETFSSCKSECPPSYCPSDDSRLMYACDPIWPCPAGCICKSGYRRNRDNLQCVLPEECPPVECTRVNEAWDRCPSPCFTDSCYDVHDENTPCNTLVKADCNPKCACIKNYARNDNDVCVPQSECPPKVE